MVYEIFILAQLYQRIKESTTADKIIPSLWFENNAYDAMLYYVSIFPDSEIVQASPTVVRAKLADVPFAAINGGLAESKPRSSMSFMVTCKTKDEIDSLWRALITEGEVHMQLGRYPWSEYYGWVGDKYGYTWQLFLSSFADFDGQRIVPSLKFIGDI